MHQQTQSKEKVQQKKITTAIDILSVCQLLDTMGRMVSNN